MRNHHLLGSVLRLIATHLPIVILLLLLVVLGLSVTWSKARAQTFVRANSPAMDVPTQFALGATWVDFDGDGDLDLYVATGFGSSRDNVLFRNDAGTFVSVTGVPLVQDGSDTACSTWADYDNDGDVDAFVSNLATGDGRLYTASSSGTLAPNLAAGFPASLKGVGCAWGDYDRDGHLDLVIAELFGQGGITTANRLFHNDGDGTFTEVVSGPVVTTTGTHHHPTWSDFDGDGDLDLFFATGSISGGTNPDHLYRNRQVETGTADFEAITTGVIATDSRSSQSLHWIDYDHDRDLDFFAVNYNGVPCQLYRHDGASFTRITTGALVTDMGSAHGATWGDFDDDGDLDVYVALDLGQSNRYYRNDGGDVFTRATTGDFVNEARSNYGAVSGDYDRDGDLDLFVPTARDEGPGVLYRNDTANGNHWLELKLVGTDSNRSGVGAKVHVLATIGGGPRWQMRELLAGTGYGGHDALEIHVGLGAATTVDSVVIEWPSGIRQALANLAADQIIVVTEPMASEVPEAAAQANDVALAIVAGTSASAPLRAIVTVARDASGSLEIFDAHGRRARPAHERAFRAGRTEIALDPEQALGAGIYWVRLQCDGETRVRRAVRLR